ncbi:unnamed protein product [Echinostoma caproni]|uniref:Transmembrane protein n=1 Tax=Echinostoma caproni TaxID=27848 RepID=A0A183ATV1_9TREM|nr:unnamed protein product [Echinostoma caproni]
MISYMCNGVSCCCASSVSCGLIFFVGLGNTVRYLGQPGRRDSHRRHPLPNYNPTTVALLSDQGLDEDEECNMHVETNPLLGQSNSNKSQTVPRPPDTLAARLMAPSDSDCDTVSDHQVVPIPDSPHANGNLRPALTEPHETNLLH